MITVGWEGTLVAGEKVAQGKTYGCGCSEVAVASMLSGRGDNCGVCGLQWKLHVFR